MLVLAGGCSPEVTMRPETQRKYVVYLSLILAATFLSGHLLSGPLKDAGEDLGPANGQFPPLVLIVFIGLTIYGTHLAARFLSDRNWRRKDYYIREVRWSLVDVIAMALVFLAVGHVYYTFASPSSEATSNGEVITVAEVLAFPLAFCVVLLFGIWILKHKGARFARSMGLMLRPCGRLIVIGVVAFLVFLPFRLIYTAVAVSCFNALGVRMEAHPVVEELLKPVGMDLKLSLVFSVVISAPFFEEIFFRGFFYQAIRKYVQIWAAVGLTAMLFAAIHPSLFQACLIFPLGLLLAYLMERTGSVIPGIVVHFLTNGTSLLLLLVRGG